MRAADTSVLIRLITRDDEEQYQAAQGLGPLWVSHVVLLETLWVLQSEYELDRLGLFRVVDSLIDHEQVVVESSLVLREMLGLVGENPKVGFADLLILEVAKASNRLPLLTFDKALAKLKGAELAG